MYQVPVLGLAETELLARLITVVRRCGERSQRCCGVEPPPLLRFSPGSSRMRARRGGPRGSCLASVKSSFAQQRGVRPRPPRRSGRLLPLGAASASRCARPHRASGPGPTQARRRPARSRPTRRVTGAGEASPQPGRRPRRRGGPITGRVFAAHA